MIDKFHHNVIRCKSRPTAGRIKGHKLSHQGIICRMKYNSNNEEKEKQDTNERTRLF